MPSSRPNTIPTVIHLLRQLKPRSILDVGVGFGKWGHLFREYTDILEAEHEPSRYERKNWRVRIEGIEGHAGYLTPMHEFLYDQIHVGDAARLMKGLGSYDLVFLGDIIEHFEKAAGMELLHDALARANKAVIVSTPKCETAQDALCGNELERHRSLWSDTDFLKVPHAMVTTVDGDTLLAVLKKSKGLKLDLTPPRQPSPKTLLSLRHAREEIEKLLPADQNFVLVDEEHLRSSLPHAQARPFLEKCGQYWGPPPDDATAIRELERLRREGACHIVFLWTTFWWIEHYAEFAGYLRANYRKVRDDESLVVFDLR